VIHSAGTIGELQLIHVLNEFVSHFNPARPHQGSAPHPGAKSAATWDAKDQ
jgi:hypothetical protein